MKIGKLHRIIVQMDGTMTNVIMTDVNGVPNLWVSLFSTGKALNMVSTLAIKGSKFIGPKTKPISNLTKSSQQTKGFTMGVDLKQTSGDQENGALM
jgi:hypothetical protein